MMNTYTNRENGRRTPEAELVQARSLDYQYAGTLCCYICETGAVTGYQFDGSFYQSKEDNEVEFLPANWQEVIRYLLEGELIESSLELIRSGTSDEKVRELELKRGKVQFLVSRFPFRSAEGKSLTIAIRELSTIQGCEATQEDILNSLEHEIRISREKSRYISSVAHDFRTPLSIIYSNLQLLEAYRFELDEETARDSFMMSRMAVKTLLRVLDKVEIIDAFGKGKLEFKPAECNLSTVCGKVIDELNEMDLMPNRIELSIEEGIQTVVIDESLCKNIFFNLLQNAMNFSEKKEKVEFSIYKGKPGVINFKVSDKGIGISGQDMEFIFDPFYRGSNSKYAKGSGLGLAVVDDCVKLHLGRISVESSPGKGSVFLVELPVIASE